MTNQDSFQTLSDAEFIEILKVNALNGALSTEHLNEFRRRGEGFLSGEQGLLNTFRKLDFDTKVKELQLSVIDSLKLESLYPKIQSFGGGYSQPFYGAGSKYDTGQLPQNVEKRNELVVSAAIEGILNQILANTTTAIKKDWFVKSMYIGTMGGFAISIFSLYLALK